MFHTHLQSHTHLSLPLFITTHQQPFIRLVVSFVCTLAHTHTHTVIPSTQTICLQHLSSFLIIINTCGWCYCCFCYLTLICFDLQTNQSNLVWYVQNDINNDTVNRFGRIASNFYFYLLSLLIFDQLSSAILKCRLVWLYSAVDHHLCVCVPYQSRVSFFASALPFISSRANRANTSFLFWRRCGSSPSRRRFLSLSLFLSITCVCARVWLINYRCWLPRAPSLPLPLSLIYSFWDIRI